MPNFLGIDHNTKNTGLFLLNFGVNEIGLEVLTHVDSRVIKTKGALQERLSTTRKAIDSFLNGIQHQPLIVAREQHHHTGEKIIQLSFCTGVIDELLFNHGYNLEKNYICFTAGQWRLITFGSAMTGMNKVTKKGISEYCGYFNEMFDIGNFKGFDDPDLADAFGLAYASGCCHFFEKDVNFKNGLSEKKERNIRLWKKI